MNHREMPPATISAKTDGSTLIEQSTTPLIALTLDGRISTWNAAAERLFGYRASDVKGQHVSILVPEECRDEQREHLEQLRCGEVVRANTVRLHRSGRRLNVHVSAGPVRDTDGTIIGLVATILETEDLHTSGSIAEAAMRRHTFLLHLGDRLRNVSDPRLIQLFACRMLAERLGVARVYYAEYEKDEDHLVIEQEYHDSLPPLAGRWRIEDFGRQVAYHFRSGTTVSIGDAKTDPLLESEVRDAYAQLQIASCVGVPLVRTGRLVMMLAALDVTPREWTPDEIELIEDTAERTWEAVERGRAEARLRTSEDRLQSSFHIETVGVIFFRAEGPIYDSNATFQRMSGYTAEEIAAGNITWQCLTPSEFRDVSLNAIREFSTRGYTTPYEKQYIRKDGSRWWGLFAARRLPDGTGVEYIIDVTERRHLEDSLRDADRRKDEFLATLGHELRNPLAPIRNGLQIVRVAGRHDPLVSRTTEMMDRQVSHLVHLVDDLLDLGRITAGKIELRRKHASLKELVLRSVEATRVFIEAHGHELAIDVPEHDIWVDADPERMTQVISNLLSNAAKYTDDGGRITLRAHVEDGTAVISVTDTGIGIPPDDLERVFDLFSQVRIHQGRSEGGLGIGLSLVKSLVTMHGGTVYAASKGPSTGSTFTVKLPLAVSDGREAVGVDPDRREHEFQPDARTILIADDNRDSTQSLAVLLGLEGYRVVTAFDGLEAIEKVAVTRPDVVILDIGMPKMNGLEAAQRIRAMPNGDRITLVALTGWGQEADRQRTQECGFDHHLVKPLDLRELSAIMSTRAPAQVIVAPIGAEVRP
jgi:PAS domain S-box-containing protein